jgi:hypothetical protein
VPDSELYSLQFRQALNDYFFLLNRGYPEKPALKLAGDRYQLSGKQRLILYRGATSRSNVRNRQKKRIRRWENQTLHVDGYNVLFTMMNYLLGKSIFIANDGFLRDAGESYGKIENESIFFRSIDLLLDFISGLKPGPVAIYLDKGVRNRPLHGKILEKGCTARKIQPEIIAEPKVDSRLKTAPEGILATSDSQIIDQTPLRVLDLARQLLENGFQVEIPELESMIIDK